MKFVDKPIYSTYQANIDLTAAAVALRFTGPPGARGMLMSVNAVVVTATDADALVRVGNSVTADAHASLTIPTAGSATDDRIVATEAQRKATVLPKDSTLQIDTDGVAGAGEVDVEVTVAWERLGA